MLLCLRHFQNPPPPPPLSSDSSTLLRTLLPPPLQLPTPFFPPRKPSFSLVRASALTPDTLPISAIQRIADKLRSLGYLEDHDSSNEPASSSSSGEIFVPAPQELPKHRVGHTLDPSWSTPERPIPGPGSGTAIVRFHRLRREMDRQRKDAGTVSPAAVPMVAELMIPSRELRRLRTEGLRIDKKLKVGKAGITEGIVNGIHERWRKAELVKIKCEDLCRMNMKRTHEILERKTRGLVVWRSGSIIILYRGTNYKYPYFERSSGEDDAVPSETRFDNTTDSKIEGDTSSTAYVNSSSGPCDTPVHQSMVCGVGSPRKVRFQLPGEAQLEEEADRLLDGLGPRFTDWWGCEPLPVDADLLPAIVPGFRRPFRLLPYGVKPKLTDREMTILRRLSRPLPCHFALGRNRNIQGLAASMVKLWEKCEIAKIAIKRGVQNTNSELMVEELKRLTGGTLLSRDREFIVFYRGKDFLPPAVSKAIEERRNSGIYQMNLWTNEISSNGSIPPSAQDPAGPALENGVHETNAQEIHFSMVGRRNTTKSAKTVNVMLSKAYEKKMRAEKLLDELEKSAGPLKQESDREAINEEERFMLRKVGLRMKPFLLLGRRGVFDGTIENMHLHWKYRELVKIISKSRSVEDVHRTARALEATSGGILVAVEKVNKGHAVIVYRGKNYQQPKNLRPKTLLNKKEALKRYVESQRIESLKLHVLKISKDIECLKDQLPQIEEECEVDDRQPVQSYKTKDASVDKLEFGISTMDQSKSPFTLDSTKSDLINSENENEFSEWEHVHLYIEPCADNNASHADQKVGVSKSAMSILSKVSEDSFIGVAQNRHISSHDQVENESNHGSGMSFKAAPLSNKERLILRKQALRMKKRPVLSVGRNNVVDGLAKTIRIHFRKHPLAVVNIKDIAKGTSFQEVVFELERATGALLVSREPNKIVLYRGWGVGEEPGVVEEKLKAVRQTSLQVEELPPELITAIKIECGMQNKEGKGAENAIIATGHVHFHHQVSPTP